MVYMVVDNLVNSTVILNGQQVIQNGFEYKEELISKIMCCNT